MLTDLITAAQTLSLRNKVSGDGESITRQAPIASRVAERKVEIRGCRMNHIVEELAPGQIARVRQRTYLIEEIVQPRRAADSTLVRLSCVDDDNQGQPLEVLWEKELDPQVLTGEAWEEVAFKGFDDSRLFAAYLNTLKWNCVTSTDPKLFQSPFRAGIRLDA